MGLLTNIALVLTLTIGIGVLLIACYYVWDYAFKMILAFFKIHRLFISFIYNHYQEKNKRPTFKPQISDHKRDEIKEKLSKNKEEK